MTTTLSIVLCCFNQFAFTRDCLADLSRLPRTHEIVVVDNGSTDETRAQLEGSSEVVYVRNAVNGGFAQGSNLGYRAATGANVLFLNNDIRVRADHGTWTAPLIARCGDGLVGPTMGLLDERFHFVREANAWDPSPSAYLSGWCLGASRDVWRQLECSPGEVFSEAFFCYFEDVDLSFRARQLGVPLQVADVPVEHIRMASSRQLNTAVLYLRARHTFVRKWGTPRPSPGPAAGASAS